jgi:hypothetical protein
MLLNARLSEGFWEEAVRTAVYLKNRSPTKAVDSATPYQAWTGQRPALSHLRSFGCAVYVYIHPDLRTKWKSKAKRCTFVGYNDYTTAQYRVWNGHRIVVVAASNAHFDEQSYGLKDYKPTPINWSALIELPYRLKEQLPVEQDVPEERMESPPSTDQPLESGEASMTIEPTL